MDLLSNPTFVLFLTITIVLTLKILQYFNTSFNYWKKRGVVHFAPEFPFGNVKDFLMRKKHFGYCVKDIYDKMKLTGHTIAGMYIFTSRVVIPLDPELVKYILVRDFQHFTDHGVYHDEKNDPLSAHLFSIEGAKWKTLRAKLSPTFTSGKIKMMFSTIIAVSSELEKTLDSAITVNKPVDIREILSRFTTDVISSCAFGLECNSLQDPENKFRRYGKRVFEFDGISGVLKRVLTITMPSLMKMLKISLFSSDVTNFYIGVVKDTVAYREKYEVKRNDFMHLLLQLKNNGKLNEYDDELEHHEPGTSLTIEEIAAQCFVFFLAGFETSSTTATFAIFEICSNPKIQETLREEILEKIRSYGELTHDAVIQMTYLDKVVAETLRKYPVLPVLNRVCTQDYKIPGHSYVIKKGEKVFIPVLGLQHDPQYYPDPEVFDPERFSEENKAKRHPYTYLPFGEGPRFCIGKKFGLLQTKIALAVLLSNYKISLNPKTPKPLRISPTTARFISPEGVIWLDVVKI